MPIPKDDKEAKKHWLQQQQSIDRPFGSKDKGLVQVDSADDIKEIVTLEAGGEAVPVYRARTAHEMPDPVARSTAMIRNVTQKGQTEADFYANVENTEDLQLYLILFGDMPDDKKAANLHKLSKLLWEKQKEVQKQLTQERNLEDKRIKNALDIQEKLERMKRRRDKDGGK